MPVTMQMPMTSHRQKEGQPNIDFAGEMFHLSSKHPLQNVHIGNSNIVCSVYVIL